MHLSLEKCIVDKHMAYTQKILYSHILHCMYTLKFFTLPCHEYVWISNQTTLSNPPKLGNFVKFSEHHFSKKKKILTINLQTPQKDNTIKI